MSGAEVVTELNARFSRGQSARDPAEAGLLVHDDCAYGSYYVSSPIAGEAGYAVETSADEYVWFDSYPEWQILNGWSISAWFKTSAVVSDYASLVTKGAFLGTMGLGGEWALQWTREGGLGFHICEYCTSSNPQQVIASANSYNLYNDGYWHHVAGTFDPALKTIAIYVDGQFPQGPSRWRRSATSTWRTRAPASLWGGTTRAPSSPSSSARSTRSASSTTR